MGKTITTYLIDGTPKGVQTVVISNRTRKDTDKKKAQTLDKMFRTKE